MAKQEYEFTLLLSGVQELTREVLDALYEAGCDDALIGVRDGTFYAEFCREGASFQEAMLSAARDVEMAGVGAKGEQVEPTPVGTEQDEARRRVFEILSQSYDTGDPEAAARHDEQQP